MNQLSLSSTQKVPFVCFHCRTSIKISLAFYYEEIGEKRWAQGVNAHCPRCKKPLAFLGRYFKVPSRSAIKQWRKAEMLWRGGWIADGYSGSPKTLRDAREFIQTPAPRNMRGSFQQRLKNEERWRRLRMKREHLRRHKDT